MKSYLFTPTRKLPTNELKRRIRSLRNWGVKASNLSIAEYKKELARRN